MYRVYLLLFLLCWFSLIRTQAFSVFSEVSCCVAAPQWDRTIHKRQSETAIVRTKETTCGWPRLHFFSFYCFLNSLQPTSVSLPCFLFFFFSYFLTSLSLVPSHTGRISVSQHCMDVSVTGFHCSGLRLGGFHLLLLQGLQHSVEENWLIHVWATAFFLSDHLFYHLFILEAPVSCLLMWCIRWRITTKTFLHLSFFLSFFRLFFRRTVIFAGRDLVHLLFPSLFWIFFFF